MKNIKLDIQRFSHTNSTENYNFPLFVGTDKPAWLSDVNGFASAADTAIKAAKDRADSAYTLADTADGKADQALTNAGSAQTDASTALTRIGTLANLTTTEKTNIVGAVNEVDSDINNLATKFNFTSFTTTHYAELGKSNVSNGNINITLATNSDGSLTKIYGSGWVQATASNANMVLSFNSVLRPSSDITINGSVIAIGGNSGGNGGYITIKTTGVVEVTIYATNNTDNNVIIPPCLYFVTDFGDTNSN